MLLPPKVRARLRRIGWLHEAVRRRRARDQEDEYVALRNRYAASSGALFSEPGWRVHSRSMLAKRWPGPARVVDNLQDVRVFVVSSDDHGGPRMLGAIQRCCSAEIFDLGKYRDYSDEAQSKRAMAQPAHWRSRLQGDVIEAFRAAQERRPFDLIFAYGSHFDFDAGTLRALAASGVPLVNLCLDDKHIFLEKPLPWPNGQKPLIGSVDVHLTNSPDSMRWYVAEGVPAYFMPQGVDPEVFRCLDVEKTYDVVFVGQKYGMRAKLVDALRAAGIRVDCFGSGWGTRRLSDAEMIEVYNRARINLGIGGTGVSERMTCIKGRDFEVPSTGGFYLTSFNPELLPLFDVGREVACYSNEIDCVELVRYYLERPGEVSAIGAAGRARTLRDHTWEVRFRDLCIWLGVLRDHDTMPSLAATHSIQSTRP